GSGQPGGFGAGPGSSGGGGACIGGQGGNGGNGGHGAGGRGGHSAAIAFTGTAPSLDGDSTATEGAVGGGGLGGGGDDALDGLAGLGCPALSLDEGSCASQ